MPGRCFVNFVFSLFIVWSDAVSAADQKGLVPQSVATVTVSKQRALQRHLLATVIAPQTQHLSAQISGIVISHRADMGKLFKQGDIIVQLDEREAQAKLTLANSEVVQAQLRLKRKELAFIRIKKTHAKGVVSVAVYDEAGLAYQQAQNELIATRAKKTIAQLDLEKHRIRAPFDGFLMSASPVVGKQVTPGEHIVGLLNKKSLRLLVDLSPQELNEIQMNRFHLLFKANELMSLKYIASSPSVNLRNGMMQAEFKYPQFDKHYVSIGEAISVQLVRDEIAVPENAIEKDEQGAYVYAVENSKTQRRALQDVSDGDQLVVLSSKEILPDALTVTLDLGSVLKGVDND